jgi:predicted RNase H-like HicB family nuclease
MAKYPEAGRPKGGSSMKYAVVYEHEGNAFGAYVPDLPGCVAVGKSRHEVERLIREAIVFHLEAMLEDGETIPEPTSWSELVEVEQPVNP